MNLALSSKISGRAADGAIRYFLRLKNKIRLLQLTLQSVLSEQSHVYDQIKQSNERVVFFYQLQQKPIVRTRANGIIRYICSCLPNGYRFIATIQRTISYREHPVMVCLDAVTAIRPCRVTLRFGPFHRTRGSGAGSGAVSGGRRRVNGSAGTVIKKKRIANKQYAFYVTVNGRRVERENTVDKIVCRNIGGNHVSDKELILRLDRGLVKADNNRENPTRLNLILLCIPSLTGTVKSYFLFNYEY